MAGLIPTKTVDQLTQYAEPLLNGSEELEIWVVNLSRKISARLFVLPSDSLVTVSDMHGSLPGSRHLVDSTTVTIVDGGAGGTLSFQVTGSLADYVGLQTVTPVGPGTVDNQVINDLVGYVDFDTAAGATDLTGIVPLFDGQRLVLSNTGANFLTLKALTGSTAANQFRINGDLTLLQYMSVALRYSSSIGKWLVMV